MNIPLKEQLLAQLIGYRTLVSGDTCCKRNGVEGPFGVLVHAVKAEDMVRFQKRVGQRFCKLKATLEAA